MKITVFQGEGVGGIPSRQELLAVWKQELENVAGITEIRYYDRMADVDVETAVGDSDAILGTYIRDDFLSASFLDRHPRLVYISCASHGYGRIDFSLLKSRGIAFTNTIFNQHAVAEFTFALLLDICHDISLHSQFYKTSRWESPNRNQNKKVLSRQISLYGKTFGIIGLGNIGVCVAGIARGFGMQVIAYSRHPKTGPEYAGIKQDTLESVLASSDILSIHCALTDDTRGLIRANTISQMKDGVILLNTARGEIVDEEDLLQALQSEKVYAAGLDVLCGEPLTKPSVLMSNSRVRVTPHIAWAPAEIRSEGVRIEAGNFKRWLTSKNK